MFGNWVPPNIIDYPDLNWEAYWLILVYERIESSKLSRPWIEVITLNWGLFFNKSSPDSFDWITFLPDYTLLAEVHAACNNCLLLSDKLR